MPLTIQNPISDCETLSLLHIRNATVITMDPGAPLLPRADLRVRDGRIEALGPDLPVFEGSEIVDASDRIVLPGFVNAHIHLWQSAVRGLGVDWSGVEFHYRVQTQFVPEITPDELRLAEYVGALSLIDGGTTSVLDWCHGNPTPDHSDAAIDGLLDAGIRGVFAHGTVKTLPTSPDQPHFSQVPHPRAEALRLRVRFGSNDGLLRLALGILGPEYSPIEVCRADFRLADELDVMSTAHVHGMNGKVPGGYFTLAEEGLLKPGHNAVHATGLSDDEIKLLVDHGASLTATPAIEARGGWREPLVRRVIEQGGRPSLGTDSEVSLGGDMLNAVRDSLLLQRHFDARRAHQTAGPGKEMASTNLVSRDAGLPPRRTPSAYEALRWATIDSAAALGIADEVGSVEVGKRADLIFLRADDVNLAPALNPVDAVVALAHAGNIDAVMIDGVFRKRDGVLLAPGLADSLARLRRSGERLLSSLGLGELTESAWG